jgi:CYTH domain-containing protein
MKNARRFLVAPCLARLISRERGVDQQIVEGYLSPQPGKDDLVRFEADKAYFVLFEHGSSGELVENLAPLPRAHAEALFGLCIGQISYDRLRLPIEGGTSINITLDRVVYPNCFDVLTVRFDDAEQAEAFESPVWFGPEVTTEFTYDWRYVALNGLQSNIEVPISSQQVEAVLDLLDQSQSAAHTNNISAAEEVIVALSRSLETSGIVKATRETAIPPGMEMPVQEFNDQMKRSAQ